jgi:hypothetical protein
VPASPGEKTIPNYLRVQHLRRSQESPAIKQRATLLGRATLPPITGRRRVKRITESRGSYCCWTAFIYLASYGGRMANKSPASMVTAMRICAAVAVIRIAADPIWWRSFPLIPPIRKTAGGAIKSVGLLIAAR